MLAHLSLVGILLYYHLCYKMRGWELTSTDCQECFIQYLGLPGCLKSYWRVWMKGLLPSLQHQEIKAFHFSQSLQDFYFIWTDWCFCGLVSERKKCSRPFGFITPGNQWACTCQPYVVSGTKVCSGAGAEHSSHSLNPSPPSVSLWKELFLYWVIWIFVSFEQSATPTTLFKIMKETCSDNHTVLREVLVVRLYLPITVWGNFTLLEIDPN